MNQRKKLMENKTTSKIPNTSKEKKQWTAARQNVVKQSGATSEKEVPWGLVNKEFQNEKKAGKTIKKSEIKKQKVSKAVSKYKTEK